MKSEHLQVVAFTLHRLKRKLNSTEFSIIYNPLAIKRNEIDLIAIIQKY